MRWGYALSPPFVDEEIQVQVLAVVTQLRFQSGILAAEAILLTTMMETIMMMTEAKPEGTGNRGLVSVCVCVGGAEGAGTQQRPEGLQRGLRPGARGAGRIRV